VLAFLLGVVAGQLGLALFMAVGTASGGGGSTRDEHEEGV
jgi:hypothetical protein